MRKAQYRLVRYAHHRLRPELKVSSRVAWLLVHRANDADLEVAELIAQLLTEWADKEIAAMGDRERARFTRTIPYWRAYHRYPLEEASEQTA